MLNLNEDDLKAAIVKQAADQLLDDGDDLLGLVSKMVRERVDKVFAESVGAAVANEINSMVRDGFDREYQKVTTWGEPTGPKTTIRKELENTVNGYWTARVDVKTGKPSSSDYSSTSRAEYLMTQICAEDFSEFMKKHAINVTGALKDGLRTQIGKQMDVMLEGLFKVRSLQDQGKVEKPY